MVFPIENSEQAFVEELRRDRVRLFVESLVKGSLRRNQKDCFMRAELV